MNLLNVQFVLKIIMIKTECQGSYPVRILSKKIAYDLNFVLKIDSKGQHSFCTVCLSGLVRGPTSIDCPLCRCNHTIRFDDVPKNRLIIQYLEMNRPQNPAYVQPIVQPHLPRPSQNSNNRVLVNV